MNHTEVLNDLIEVFWYESYLEIGVENPSQNFDLIRCPTRIGVDPECNERLEDSDSLILAMSSDDYFSLKEHTQLIKFPFDLIFIDGDHSAEQVYKDITNSFKWLREGGAIVVHDVNPTTELMQITPRDPRAWDAWTGDGWKAWSILARFNWFVIDTDYGCGIAQGGHTNRPPELIEALGYKDLERAREMHLNLKSIDWFEQWLITHKTTKSELS